MDLSKANQTDSEGVKKRGFNLQIPETLYTRLKFYVDNHARRHESMTYLINRAIEEKLDKLEAESEKK
jgi:hypothetical protein